MTLTGSNKKNTRNQIVQLQKKKRKEKRKLIRQVRAGELKDERPVNNSNSQPLQFLDPDALLSSYETVHVCKDRPTYAERQGEAGPAKR